MIEQSLDPKDAPGRRGTLRICVLGCGGFIGAHLVAWLLERSDAQVAGIDSRHERVGEFLAAPLFSYHEGSPRHDEQLIRRLIRRSDVVVYLDWSIESADPLAYFKTHLTDRLRLVEWCAREGKRLVYLSSGSVQRAALPDPPAAFRRRDQSAAPAGQEPAWFVTGPVDDPGWLPASTGQLIERFVHAAALHYGTPYTILRAFDAVGPGIEPDPWRDPASTASLIIQAIDGLRGGGSVVVLSCAPDMFCAPLFVADAVEGLGRAVIGVRSTDERQTLNLGNPANAIKAHELAGRIIALYGQTHAASGEAPLDPSPRLVFDPSRDRGVPFARYVADVGEARRVLGWTPRWGLDETLSATVASLLRASGHERPTPR